MSNSQNPDDLQAIEASAGEAQRLNRRAVRMRAEVSNLLQEEALEERQFRFRERRRSGGPEFEELSEDSARTSAIAMTEESTDIPPTECAEPPQTE
jgi:hypothetical protein